MKLIDKTPRSFSCGIGACPAIFETDHGTYVLVGRKIAGQLPTALTGRIGADEIAIEVPKELLAAVGIMPPK